MNVEEKDANLKQLAENLSDLVESDMIELVEFKPAGAGSFVHAIERSDRTGRAIEVSYLEDDRIWVEYWEASADEYAQPVNEASFDDMTQTERNVRAWLPGIG